MTNTLFYGDNLDILTNPEHIPPESVDLIYLDPPFNSNASYNVLFNDKGGARSAGQLAAFKDTWSWPEAAPTFEVLKTDPSPMGKALRAFRELLPDGGLLAYLVMMAPRLAALHRVLKPTGSLYLHCDPTASHYLKVVMDAIFGVKGYRNEVSWRRTNVHSDSQTWSRVRDVLLFYTRSDQFTWSKQFSAYNEAYISTKYRYADSDGRHYMLDNMTSPNPRPNMMYEWRGHASPPKGWRYSQETMAELDRQGRIWYPSTKDKRPRLKRYLDEMPGTLLTDSWDDINPINSQAAERLGYPTQKPQALLERIMAASSNPGDLVLDPFCGCGTTIAAAQALGRRWLGIDITWAAIATMRQRLAPIAREGQDYVVVGEPTTPEDAARLAEENPYQFQWWITDKAGGRPAEKKKGADHGVDGLIYFSIGDRQPVQTIVLSVKAGRATVAQVRDLRGTIERESAAIGALLTMHLPTGPMLAEAAAAGLYTSPWGQHPRLQILTAAQLLAGHRLDYPQVTGANVTYQTGPAGRQAPSKQQPSLDL